MKPEFIIIHHSAVSRELNNHQFEAVKNYHKNLGWGDIGYHYFIEPNGKVCKGRIESKIGAHCRYAGMNIKSLGVCLTGNFMTETPRKEQIFALRDLLKAIVKRYEIKAKNILGHNETGAATLCPGKFIDMKFIRLLPTR